MEKKWQQIFANETKKRMVKNSKSWKMEWAKLAHFVRTENKSGQLFAKIFWFNELFGTIKC